MRSIIIHAHMDPSKMQERKTLLAYACLQLGACVATDIGPEAKDMQSGNQSRMKFTSLRSHGLVSIYSQCCYGKLFSSWSEDMFEIIDAELSVFSEIVELMRP